MIRSAPTKRQWQFSLKYRIALIIFLLEAIMMATVLGVTLGNSRDEAEKQLAANELVMLQLLADLSRVALLTAEYDELQPYIEEVVRDPHVKTVLVGDRRGRVVVSNDYSYLGKPMPNLDDTPLLNWITRTVANSGGAVGKLAIQFSHEELERTNREIRNLGVSIALIGMALIAIVGILIGHLLTRRLETLSAAAGRLASGDLTVRTSLGGHDEVAIVGRAFDTMAGSISEYVERLKHATDLLEQRVGERTRELAVARDAAVAANRSKSAFLANMSHEIRTPLTAIIGFSETLLDAKQPMAERVESIRTIIRSGEHLLRIINDILDVSKIEAEKIEIESIPVNPFEVIEDIEAISTMLAQEKGLSFEVEFAYPLPVRIVSDPLRLKQVLINLCNNAVKFTARGGVRLKVACDLYSESMTFKVIDTGIGMTPVQMANVFQAFVQADTSTTREYGGTGLGLYLSRQLAERLGGGITVESTPEVGSCFVLSISTGAIDSSVLTHVRPVPPRPLPDPAAHQVSVQGHVLVAEDNPDNQRLVSFLLRRSGAEVMLVDNGEKAVAVALQGKYDLVFMDMQMPVMGGLEATRLLRQKGYRGPIVALTANALKSDADECFAAGCDAFATKPVQKEKLNELLVRYLTVVQGVVSRAPAIVSSLLDSEPALADLVVEFVRRLPKSVDEIKADLARGDIDAIRAHTHALKGTSANFGYPDLHRLCQRIEFEITKDSEAGIAQALVELDALVERIERGLPGKIVVFPQNTNG